MPCLVGYRGFSFRSSEAVVDLALNLNCLLNQHILDDWVSGCLSSFAYLWIHLVANMDACL